MDLFSSRYLIFVGLVWAAALNVQSAAAEGAQHDFSEFPAHHIVQDVQNNLLTTVSDFEGRLESDEKAFLAAVEVILKPIVDFNYIARGVMGGYSDKIQPAQKTQFTEVFKGGLVSTYAKGMAAYADRDIEILPPKGDISGQKRINVAQEVRGEGVNRVSYTMKLNRAGEWKLVNIVLNGINLGITFRTQFYQAMKKNDGNIDKVIADWSTE